jgi:Tol biopolymer transport system component
MAADGGGRDAGGTASDAGGRDGGSPIADGGDVDAGPLGPFSEPELVAELNDPASQEDDPTLREDLLEIFFDSSRVGGMGSGDIWTSTRASLDAAWDPPTNVAVLNSSGDDTACELSADGLTLHFASDRPGGAGVRDLYVSTRPSLAGAWAAPQRVAALSSPETDEAAVMTADALLLVFASSRSSADLDLFRATRADRASPWTAITRIAELSSPDSDGSPFLSHDGRVLYLHSARAGGSGDNDLWVATRTDPRGPFAAPTRVDFDDINTDASESDPWVSPDGRTMYFSSDRDGNQELFVARR